MDSGTDHPNVVRVREAAGAGGVPIEVRRFPEGTRTADDAARAIGCGVEQIVKSLVFVADDRPVVALVSGADRVDTERLAEAIGATSARRASGEEARLHTGYPIGGVPPIGHRSDVTVVLDAHLLGHRVVWAAAGLPDAVFEIEPQTLARISGAVVRDVRLRAL